MISLFALAMWFATVTLLVVVLLGVVLWRRRPRRDRPAAPPMPVAKEEP